jgi:hypothetical protein
VVLTLRCKISDGIRVIRVGFDTFKSGFVVLVFPPDVFLPLFFIFYCYKANKEVVSTHKKVKYQTPRKNLKNTPNYTSLLFVRLDVNLQIVA